MDLDKQIEQKREELSVLYKQQTAGTLEVYGCYSGKYLKFDSTRCAYVESIESGNVIECRARGVNVYLQEQQFTFCTNDRITINMRKKPSIISAEEFNAFIKEGTDRIAARLVIINHSE